MVDAENVGEGGSVLSPALNIRNKPSALIACPGVNSFKLDEEPSASGTLCRQITHQMSSE